MPAAAVPLSCSPAPGALEWRLSSTTGVSSLQGDALHLVFHGVAPGVDLLVQNISSYARWGAAAPDGVTEANFGRINLLAPRPGSGDSIAFVDLRFTFLDASTREPIFVPSTQLTVMADLIFTRHAPCCAQW